MRILGIETSCDETAAAIYDENAGVLSHRVHSQVALHDQYGGVVPELAARDHLTKILPVIESVLKDSKLTLQQLNGIAYTKGPGLVGALLIGAMTGQTLSYALNIPAIPIHHLEGHLLAAMLEEKKPAFPFLALLVSGGHTLLIKANKLGHYEILGETLDDAVGEAFDKTAKLLGLPYPGGAHLASLALKGKKRFLFPRPMVDRPGLDFSFSGLKTFAVNTIKTHILDEQTKADVAFAFEEAVIDTLVIKCKRAIEKTHIKHLVIAGGVGANLNLRQRLTKLMEKVQGTLFTPRTEYCTDNAAMIAYAGFLRFKMERTPTLSVDVSPRFDLLELTI